MIENNEINSEAYTTILEKYNKNPNELNELLCLYMRSVINGFDTHMIMYLDEIENMLGINKHEEILKVIMIN
jgi:hypothetical protein